MLIGCWYKEILESPEITHKKFIIRHDLSYKRNVSLKARTADEPEHLWPYDVRNTKAVRVSRLGAHGSQMNH